MASETTALDVLQRQVESLTTQLQTLTSQRDEYRDALTEISGERDALKAKIAQPDAQAARISELEGAIRDRQHYDKFAELAKGAKAKDAALRHLWQVSGYKAEHDEIDDHALRSLVAKLKESADYAFDAEPNPWAPGGEGPREAGSAARDLPDQVRARDDRDAPGRRRPGQPQPGRRRHHRHPGDAGRPQVHVEPGEPRADHRGGQGRAIPLKTINHKGHEATTAAAAPTEGWEPEGKRREQTKK